MWKKLKLTWLLYVLKEKKNNKETEKNPYKTKQPE